VARKAPTGLTSAKSLSSWASDSVGKPINGDLAVKGKTRL